MIYMVTFSIGRNGGSGSTRGNIASQSGERKTIVVPSAKSRGEALLLAAAQVSDDDVYAAKVDSMQAEILEIK